MKNALQLYITGFILSLILTLAAYFSVINHWLTGNSLLIVIFALAFLQLIVQLFFFLHMSKEEKPYWNFQFFITTIGVILIIIVGSIWIMKNLNSHMTTKQMEHYVQSQDGF
jgi:cytochrome o ubiquinol oxidase operon protein cyoD